MSHDLLKLTTYFGERDRVGGRLVADALLDLYADRRVLASVVLRGAEGFGRLHHRHTDELLSLSEDLPVVATAIDGRDAIDALLEPVLGIVHRGLVTLERARSDDSSAVTAAAAECTKLTIFLGRRERVGDQPPAHRAICDLLHRRGVAGATVLLGVDGTRRGERERGRFFSANARVPMTIVAVGTEASIAPVLVELRELAPDPLIALERVQVCKRDGRLLARPAQTPARDPRGLALWQKLSVYSSQSASVNGRSLSAEVVRRLRAGNAAGATSLRGIWGFHGDHAPHGDRVLQVRRHVPVVTIVIDAPERIARSFDVIDELTAEQGLVTSELVPAMSAISATERAGGLRLASPPSGPATL